MKRTGGLFLVLIGLSLLASAAQAQTVTLYAATGSNGTAGSLYTIDLTTGAANLVGPIVNASGGGALGITGLAFDPLNGVLYGVTVNNTLNGNTLSQRLVTINPNTAVATVIGSLGSAQGDISFRSDGTLFGFQATGDNSLTTINLSTGLATEVG